MNHSDKVSIIQLVLSHLKKELEAILFSVQSAHDAATHEESKSEDSHDTRAIEASYLAGAQRARVEALKKVITYFQVFQIPYIESSDFIQIGTLVELELENKRYYYFLMSLGGGIQIMLENKVVQVITPQSPLGESLFDKKIGDSFELEHHKKNKEYHVLSFV